MCMYVFALRRLKAALFTLNIRKYPHVQSSAPVAVAPHALFAVQFDGYTTCSKLTAASGHAIPATFSAHN